MVPARIAPMLISGQNPAPSFGRKIAFSTPPNAAPIISKGPKHSVPNVQIQRNHPVSRI